MCSHCGCQSILVIRQLTLQHEEIINKVGAVRRAFKKQDLSTAQLLAAELGHLMNTHTVFEEDGLFAALMSDLEFKESLVKLMLEHTEIDILIGRLIENDISILEDLDRLLRNHIGNEENGIFPASAVTLDGSIWDQIERDHGILDESSSA